ncbi:MAG: helix-hairpin-helix domain-containing protein [Balneolaceae bacterium]|nr:helix-hairpin-helix domain-containing protein [Balneolaceae bacterium]
MNINTASSAELLQVPGLNLKLSRAILDYRQQVKPFESVDELQEVSGIGQVTLQRIRPYVSIGQGSELAVLYTDPRYWTGDGKFDLFSRYQQTLQREGYRRPDSTGYLGSPIKYYQRMRYRSNHISANLTQEKDAGEPLKDPTKFDYNSWHLALTDNGKLKEKLWVGDYNLAFGEGRGRRGRSAVRFWKGAGSGRNNFKK